ncbi:MAG: purine-binding chemotaxis protein CheW [Nitrospirae bacterium]|nr:purine-binding chemotaxis protein CheW [Nitrospirota bacterium]
MEKFAVFRISDEDFGVRIDKVVEILKSQKIYSLPDLPVFFSGVINIRGDVIPLLDLGRRFGIHSGSGKDRIMIVNCEGEKIGLLVDEIEEIVSLTTEDIIAPPSIFKGLKTEYLTGLGKNKDKIIILLNLDRILTSEEKITLRKSAELIEENNERTGKTA